MNIAIIGAGIMGLSTARALARAGHRVTVFEQYTIPNPAGSSFDDHRLIRFPYGNMVRYMEMVAPAYDAWQDLWTDLGTSYYKETGTLLLGTSAEGWASQSRHHLEAYGQVFTDLSQDELSRQFPFLSVDDVRISFKLNTGGILEASNILKALKALLQAKGVNLLEHMKVEMLDPENATINVEGRRYAFDKIIVTAGPWITTLMEEFSAFVTPSRQPVVYLTPAAAHVERWHNTPMILDIDHASGFYLVPPRAGTGLKIGDHRFTLAGDPDHHEEATDEDIQSVLEAAYQRIPGLKQYPLYDAPVRYYTVSDKERFIARCMDKTWVLTGFSGHGFKFGPLIGNHMAQTIAGDFDAELFVRWIAGENV